MRWLLALTIVGCGGGPSIAPADPKVEIISSSCDVQSGGFLVVNVDYDVTLDFEQAFEATVNTGGTGTQISNFYSCGSWDSTFQGGDNRGCERDQATDSETQFIEHTFNAQLGATPVSFTVQVIGSALDAPLSDVMLANDSASFACSVPLP